MSEFENTPVVLGRQATSYGEMRSMARQTRDASSPANVMESVLRDPALLTGAIRGLCETVLYLLDEVEQLTEKLEGDQ